MSSQKPTTHRRARTILWCLVLAIVAAMALSVFARTGAVLRNPVTARLAAIGDQLGGSFSFDRIHPAGLTSVAIDGLTFVPNTGDGEHDANSVPIVSLDTVRVTPHLGALLNGDVWPQSVRIENPQITLLADSDGGGHTPWIDALSDRVQALLADDETEGDDDTAHYPLPSVRVNGGFMAFEDPAGRYPSLGVHIEHVTLTPPELTHLQVEQGTVPAATVTGAVNVEGLGRGMVTGQVGGEDPTELTLRMLQDNDLFALLPDQWTPSPDASLSIGAVAFSWPPAVRISPVSFRRMNMRLPGIDTWRLDDVWVDGFELAFDRYGVHLDWASADLTFGGLLDNMDIDVDHGRVFRSWDHEQTFVDLQVLDPNDNPLRIRIDRVSSTDLTTARVDGELVDMAELFELVPAHDAIDLQRGIFSGEVLVEWMPGSDTVSGFVFASMVNTDINMPVMSHLPLTNMTLGLDARFEASLTERRFELTDTTIGVGAMPIELNAHIQLAAEGSDVGNQIEFSARVALMDAQTALESLPQGLAPIIDDFQLGGEFGFDAQFNIDSADLDNMVADVTFNVETLEVIRFGEHAPLPLFAEDEYEWQAHTFEGRTRTIGPDEDTWMDLDDIPHHLYRAILAAEDDGFWRHDGFEWRSIRRALSRNIDEGRFVQGGSTISQQVVKNLFLSHDRTFGRKLQELFLTWQMEQNLGKRQILELYVNIVHWGPGIYGIDEAAQAYFRHVPRSLTLRESAFLAAILPNPALFGEQYARSIISPSRRGKMRNILTNMHRRGYVTDLALEGHLAAIERGRISLSPIPTHLGERHTVEPALDSVDDLENAGAYGSLFIH